MAIDFVVGVSDPMWLLGRIVMGCSGVENGIGFRWPIRVAEASKKCLVGERIPTVFGEINFSKDCRDGQGGYYREQNVPWKHPGYETMTSGLRGALCVCDTLDEVIDILNVGYDYEQAENALRKEFAEKARALSGRRKAD